MYVTCRLWLSQMYFTMSPSSCRASKVQRVHVYMSPRQGHVHPPSPPVYRKLSHSNETVNFLNVVALTGPCQFLKASVSWYFHVCLVMGFNVGFRSRVSAYLIDLNWLQLLCDEAASHSFSLLSAKIMSLDILDMRFVMLNKFCQKYTVCGSDPG
jgi:hypothetical protein